MPYQPFSPGAPQPGQSLFGNAGGPLEILQRMLSSSGLQPPAPPQAPAQPTPPAGAVDPVSAELDKQMRADPIAQQNIGNPDYEDQLRAELVKELKVDNDPGRAISKALAAAGAAINGGQDVWQGISTGVTAYHGARDDPAGRIGTLKTLSEMDRDEADRPFEAEEHAASLDLKRSQAERNRSPRTRAALDPAEQARRDARDARATVKDGFDARIKIEGAVDNYRKKLADEQYATPEEERQSMVEEYRQELESQAGALLNLPAASGPPLGSTSQAGTPMPGASPGLPQASPDSGGAPDVIHQHPETGQRVYWNGREWVDIQTNQPVGFGG